ncbi:hypothetical protein R1sor_010872 [Riccia sorocarpa]|uniref:FLYWCH-type domain-containing protein n=1 Tax=Riccia sorocarpa TaxID=122646 RepID=A0ABD3I0Q1_9MARC
MGSHTYIKSQKGNDQLVFNGYFFEEDSRKNDEHIYWRCVETNRGCKGRVIQDESGMREGRNEHDHPPRTMEIEVRRALDEIRSQAGTQHAETPHSVVAGVISGVAEDVLGSLPSTQAMKKQDPIVLSFQDKLREKEAQDWIIDYNERNGDCLQYERPLRNLLHLLKITTQVYQTYAALKPKRQSIEGGFTSTTVSYTEFNMEDCS